MEIPRKSARPKKPKKFFEDELYDSRQCSVCSTESNVKSGTLLKCQVCVRWMHSFCVQMTQEILGQWKKMAESFICRKCCFSGLDRFNYQESLRR